MTIINGWQSPASYFVAHNSMPNARCHMFHIHKPLQMHSLLKPAASVKPWQTHQQSDSLKILGIPMEEKEQ